MGRRAIAGSSKISSNLVLVLFLNINFYIKVDIGIYPICSCDFRGLKLLLKNLLFRFFVRI